MPYLIDGFDSAGVAVQVTLEDDGTMTGDPLLLDWLALDPIPPPPEGSPEPVPGDPLSEERLEQIRQHVSRLLTYTHVGPPPPPVEPVLPEPEPEEPPPVEPLARATSTRDYTAAELDAMTVTDLRSLAAAAQIAGGSSMHKAELIAALLAQQGA